MAHGLIVRTYLVVASSGVEALKVWGRRLTFCSKPFVLFEFITVYIYSISFLIKMFFKCNLHLKKHVTSFIYQCPALRFCVKI